MKDSTLTDVEFLKKHPDVQTEVFTITNKIRTITDLMQVADANAHLNAYRVQSMGEMIESFVKELDDTIGESLLEAMQRLEAATAGGKS